MAEETIINTIAGPEVPITCMAGTTFNPVFSFFDDEDEEVPSDLSGSSFRMKVKDKAGNPVLEFSTEDGGGMTIVDNEVQFDVNEDTMDVTHGKYNYTLIETTYEGVVLTAMYGPFDILKNQTPPV